MRLWKPFPSCTRFKALRESPTGKTQKVQYLLAVCVDRYLVEFFKYLDEGLHVEPAATQRSNHELCFLPPHTYKRMEKKFGPEGFEEAEAFIELNKGATYHLLSPLDFFTANGVAGDVLFWVVDEILP